MEAESKSVQRDLTAARSRVEVGVLRSEQAQQQAQARQKRPELARRLPIRPARISRSARPIGAASRPGRLRAREGWRPAAERRTAESAVASAQLSYDAALAEYNRAFAGPTDIDARAADQAVSTAQLQLARRPRPICRSWLTARTRPRPRRRARSVARPEHLRSGRRSRREGLPARPVAVSSAQRDVQRAEWPCARPEHEDDRRLLADPEGDLRPNAQSILQRCPGPAESAQQGAAAGGRRVGAARHALGAARRSTRPRDGWRW